MKLNQHLKGWKQIVSQRFPQLSLPQVSGLAAWSFGMVMTQSSSLTRVSSLIAKINQEKDNTVRQRLKEWYKEGKAKAKKDNKRVSLEVKDCFASLLSWIVDLLPKTTQELPIGLDATSIGQNFTVLSINVLYRSCGIPIAWKVVRGTEKGSWKPYWQELFQSLNNIVPKNWKVIVSADRGLYADWLYQQIVELGWHPFLRINHQGQYREPDSSSWQPLASVVSRSGQSWSGKITCFKTNPIDCTLLAQWDEDYADPWLILTDLNPNEGNILWYGFRSWIESSYRDVKSDGWQWQRTRLRNPDRAERHWLAMAVALLWMVTLGGESETQSDEELISDSEQSSSTNSTRQVSCFLNGLLTVVAQLLNGQSLTLGRLLPIPFSHFKDLAFEDSS
ncbi:MAG: transposase [Xenococcaceae cyanobacterium MO_188.B29]|nr:transposase [Xenococcaceae cyanobacterium MO_188.B29]